VTRFGMSDRLGKLTWGRSAGPQFLKSPFELEERNYSEQTAETIDAELKRILEDIYRRVMEILLKNREPMERIAHELIRKETLDRAELDRLMAAPSPAGDLVAGR